MNTMKLDWTALDSMNIPEDDRLKMIARTALRCAAEHALRANMYPGQAGDFVEAYMEQLSFSGTFWREKKDSIEEDAACGDGVSSERRA